MSAVVLGLSCIPDNETCTCKKPRKVACQRYIIRSRSLRYDAIDVPPSAQGILHSALCLQKRHVAFKTCHTRVGEVTRARSVEWMGKDIPPPAPRSQNQQQLLLCFLLLAVDSRLSAPNRTS